MDATQMKQWLSSVARVMASWKAELLKALGAIGHAAQVRSLAEAHMSALVACQLCGGGRIVRNGSASGWWRDECRACQRSFNSLSSKPLVRVRLKVKWLAQQGVL